MAIFFFILFDKTKNKISEISLFVIYKSDYGYNSSFAHVGGAELLFSSDWSNHHAFCTTLIHKDSALPMFLHFNKTLCITTH